MMAGPIVYTLAETLDYINGIGGTITVRLPLADGKAQIIKGGFYDVQAQLSEIDKNPELRSQIKGPPTILHDPNTHPDRLGR